MAAHKDQCSSDMAKMIPLFVALCATVALARPDVGLGYNYRPPSFKFPENHPPAPLPNIPPPSLPNLPPPLPNIPPSLPAPSIPSGSYLPQVQHHQTTFVNSAVNHNHGFVNHDHNNHGSNFNNGHTVLTGGNLNHGTINHGSFNHGSLNHGSINHGNLNHDSFHHGNVNHGNINHQIQGQGLLTNTQFGIHQQNINLGQSIEVGSHEHNFHQHHENTNLGHNVNLDHGVNVNLEHNVNIDTSANLGHNFNLGHNVETGHIVNKHVYVYTAPEEPEHSHTSLNVLNAPRRKNYKIIFIKAPTYQSHASIVAQQQAQTAEKTLIYVLSKKPEDIDINLAAQTQAQRSKPEVYFIKYKSKHAAAPIVHNTVQNTVVDHGVDQPEGNFGDGLSVSNKNFAFASLPTKPTYGPPGQSGPY